MRKYKYYDWDKNYNTPGIGLFLLFSHALVVHAVAAEALLFMFAGVSIDLLAFADDAVGALPKTAAHFVVWAFKT